MKFLHGCPDFKTVVSLKGTCFKRTMKTLTLILTLGPTILTMGCMTVPISGRKAFQKPKDEGIELLHAIQDVYLEKEVTVA